MAGVSASLGNRIRDLILFGAARGAEHLATRNGFGLPGLAHALTQHDGRPGLGLLTGFPVRLPDGRVTFETDGPVGAGHLALMAAVLGWQPILVTDAAFAGMVDAITEVARDCGLAFEPQVLLLDTKHLRPDGQEEARAALASVSLTHLVALERPGRARDGQHYSMCADRLDGAFIPADFLFEAQDWLTGAFADGGNEIGMGRIGYRRIAAHIAHGRIIASRTKVDHLSVCGVSNWGAYGLVAMLALALPEKRAALLKLFTPETDEKLISALIAAGAVDGVTRRSEPTVDGLPAALHHQKIVALRELITSQPRKKSAINPPPPTRMRHQAKGAKP